MSQGLCLTILGLWMSKLFLEMLCLETNPFIHGLIKRFLNMSMQCARPWQDSDEQDRQSSGTDTTEEAYLGLQGRSASAIGKEIWCPFWGGLCLGKSLAMAEECLELTE